MTSNLIYDIKIHNFKNIIIKQFINIQFIFNGVIIEFNFSCFHEN